MITTYIIWYLAIGAILFVVLTLYPKKDDKGFIEDAVYKQKDFWNRSLSDIAIGILAVLLLIIGWLFIAIWAIKLKIFGDNGYSEDINNPEFTVMDSDLLEAMTIEEIERQEIVFDPLGAVPNIPFGHLNFAWQRFIENINSSDTIMTFSSKFKVWGESELRSGYAIVREGNVESYFLTDKRQIEKC